MSRRQSAQSGWLSSRREPGMLALEILDDGVGFDPAQHGAGLGLRGMRERLALLGGELAILSSAGSGTLLRASIPVA